MYEAFLRSSDEGASSRRDSSPRSRVPLSAGRIFHVELPRAYHKPIKLLRTRILRASDVHLQLVAVCIRLGVQLQLQCKFPYSRPI